ncbi:MAG: iron-sulfur cluster assembly scaffold protein [Sphingomicrobium sp.]
MNAPLYTIDILRLAASLAPPRQLEREDGCAELRSPTCGSRVAAAVQRDADIVQGLSLEVHACAFGQASAALLQRSAIGRTRDQVARAADELGGWLGGSDQVPDWPETAALAPARSRTSRHAAILLPFRALLAAMDDAS